MMTLHVSSRTWKRAVEAGCKAMSEEAGPADFLSSPDSLFVGEEVGRAVEAALRVLNVAVAVEEDWPPSNPGYADWEFEQDGFRPHLDGDDTAKCWCKPRVVNICPECEGHHPPVPNCWRCGGDGVLDVFDPDLPTITVHNE